MQNLNIQPLLSFSAPQLSHDIPAATGLLCDKIAVLRDMLKGMPYGRIKKSCFEDSGLLGCDEVSLV